MNRIPIIIPFYRDHQNLERCLEYARAQTYPNIEIFVRDNTHDNIYFTAAVNEGLQKFAYDPAIRYAVILNQDAFLHPDAIRILAEFLDRNPRCAIAAPLQLTPQGRVSWGGSLNAFPVGIHRCDPLENYRQPMETHWANGAALMVRLEAVREVGLWDRNLRFICSDVDFSFSCRARGWNVQVVPAARCEHMLNASAGGDSDIELIKLKDAIYFARKWISGDLYRTLSFEGPSLMRLGVRQEIDRLQRAADSLERRLAAAR
jgi:GT2 family glycosyltransferase